VGQRWPAGPLEPGDDIEALRLLQLHLDGAQQRLVAAL
jgi:hypothetical protein